MFYLITQHCERYPSAEALRVKLAQNEIFNRNHDFSLSQKGHLVKF
jgi:hypothetical protein